eukprot:4904965-Alexandrium_andersonii.AAC.1
MARQPTAPRDSPRPRGCPPCAGTRAPPLGRELRGRAARTRAQRPGRRSGRSAAGAGRPRRGPWQRW